MGKEPGQALSRHQTLRSQSKPQRLKVWQKLCKGGQCECYQEHLYHISSRAVACYLVSHFLVRRSQRSQLCCSSLLCCLLCQTGMLLPCKALGVKWEEGHLLWPFKCPRAAISHAAGRIQPGFNP